MNCILIDIIVGIVGIVGLVSRWGDGIIVYFSRVLRILHFLTGLKVITVPLALVVGWVVGAGACVHDVWPEEVGNFPNIG
jgi:hypothetical protein